MENNKILWVVMGVSGCGKSTVGQALALARGVPFIEGDEYHPASNVAKMSAGQPLDDDDRADWLRALRTEVRGARDSGTGLVLSCSALKRGYRDLLREADPALRFAHLDGPRALIAARMQARVDHYMPPSLLDSQFRDLQPLQADEAGISLDIRLAPADLVAAILGNERGRPDAGG
ncbi:gluconokinase [Pseudoduganella namucuonensis]|uniref:Gluconokinase n=1 Tax=Pseudoduganella namucuonensis TaxID=1035707 RepID=A0A1I7F554_9BURK|nr:gluconokinase [Pseudoduganella namucuonensis]SFU31235.1 gluconate kinase, SKI family [Pseudoduganella namucuonensis]